MIHDQNIMSRVLFRKCHMTFEGGGGGGGVILKCEKESFSRKGLLFLRKGLTLSVIGFKCGDNFTISILKMLLMVQSTKITLTCFYLSLLKDTFFSAYMRRVAFIITSNKHTLSLFLTSKDSLI